MAAERTLRIEIAVASDDELDALRGALLSARASELAEVRRRGGRLFFGYGSDSARESMTDEVGRAKLRWTMLDRILAELERSPKTPNSGADDR